MTGMPTHPGRRFAGRTAVVTGGARGVGLAIARRLASEGASVAVWDIDGAAAIASAGALGGEHLGQTVDVADEVSVARATATAYDRLGRVDVLINNAGILGPVAPLWEQSPDAFRRVMDVNLTGMYLVCRALVPRMRAETAPPKGRIVNISSVQGKEGLVNSGAYGISKAGVIALTKILGKELAGDGIMVNCVTPAAAETDMAEQMTSARRADIVSRIPMGRFILVDEIASMVAFLASEECTFSTAAAFDLSGGRATY